MLSGLVLPFIYLTVMSKAGAWHLRSVIKHINSPLAEICGLTRSDLCGSVNDSVELIFSGCVLSEGKGESLYHFSGEKGF